ncbi:P-loop NTPase [Candidatus Latescibacterota bacterium]
MIHILQRTTNKRVWTFAGGKGGTGKTVMTANIGIALATMGHHEIVVDADLGGPNLHTILNIKRPKVSLTDFIKRRIENIEEILLPTPSDNLRLISGGSVMSNEGFVVCNPELTAKINAYSFLKSVVYRTIEKEYKRGTRIHDLIIREGRDNKTGVSRFPNSSGVSTWSTRRHLKISRTW